MVDEGYIKYKCVWEKAPPPELESIQELNFWRKKLYQLNLIGVYPDDIGFGNISIRHPDNKNYFIISGTQTGVLKELNQEHYSIVTSCSLEKNLVCCSGLIKASSESLTHGTVYKLNEKINAVIHVHSKEMWNKFMYKIPTTSAEISYGTVEMGKEVERLYLDKELAEFRIFVMAGHEDGIVALGNTLSECGDVLLDYLSKVHT